MLKIATHNSATGEKPANFISWLVIPFARTQSKTIAQQIESGCRMFDLRVKKYKNEYHSAHGIFTTKRTFEDIVSQINEVKGKVYATITYETKFKNEEEKQEFLDFVKKIKETYSHIIWGEVAVKYVDYDTVVDWVSLETSEKFYADSVSKFIPLNGKTWQTYIPIPWLWKKIYYNKPEFNEEKYTYVDFL